MDTELFKGTLSLLILAMLSRKAMYGYELAATVHQHTRGAFTFREGSLYPSLHKLQAEGLLRGEWEDGPSTEGPGTQAAVLPHYDKGSGGVGGEAAKLGGVVFGRQSRSGGPA